MLGFIIGFMIGGCMGMFLTASVTVASECDDREERLNEQEGDSIPTKV